MVEDGENNVNNEIKLFEGKQVRSAWNNEKEEWYFFSSGCGCSFDR